MTTKQLCSTERQSRGWLKEQVYQAPEVAMYHPDDDRKKMQQNIILRLKKIEGQIRGLQNMINDGKPCEQILIQVRAALSALKSVSNLVFKSYLMKCVNEIGEKPTPDDIMAKLDDTIGMLNKFIGV